MTGIHIAVVTASALGLLGCALAPVQNAEIEGRSVCHPRLVAHIENEFKRQNGKVYWVNCPRVVVSLGPLMESKPPARSPENPIARDPAEPASDVQRL